MNEITQSWQTYFAKVYPHGCTKEQEHECKQAFFAGAFVLFNTMLVISSIMSEKDAEKRLRGIECELQEVLRSRCANLGKQN